MEHIKGVAKGLEKKIIELQQKLDGKVRYFSLYSHNRTLSGGHYTPPGATFIKTCNL